MEFVGIKDQYKILNNSINKRIQKVMDHGQFIMGPEVFELEESLKRYTNSDFCISTSSGTDALLMALMAIGIKSGDEIITTPFTWASNAEMIMLLGAKPVYVDINLNTYNLDAGLISKAITNKTKAIMPVSLFGQCCDMDEINLIAKKNNLIVIEDAAQSFGAEYKNKKSCNLSDIGCTSFFPTKPLGGYGDSGACFTNDEELAEKMKKIRSHGQSKKNIHQMLGINGRMDTIQAAIIIEKLSVFENEIKLRNSIADNYNKLLDISNLGSIKKPFIEKECKSVYAQYSILSENRDLVKKKLSRFSIPSVVFYPHPLYNQKAYEDKSFSLKITEKVCKEILSLPMNPYMTKEEQEKVVQSLTL